MSEQSSSNNRPPQRPGQNSNRRYHGKRRPPNKTAQPQQPGKPNHNPNNNQRQGQGPGPENKFSLADRIYEKYQNLLEQHINARRKFHDLFYRADLPQKNKLERLFNSTLKEIRDFEGRLNPHERELFEKRHNGLALDLTYSTLNAAALEASVQIVSEGPSDPHYMQSQKNASYKDDREESVGSKDDYEKYRIAH
jgi:hypothetical protein